MKPTNVETIAGPRPAAFKVEATSRKAPIDKRGHPITLGPLEHIAASSFGGTLTAFAVTPLDVIKTRLQAQGPRTSAAVDKHYITGTVDGLVKIAQHEGVRNLWRGLTPSLLMTVPSTAIYFSTYEKIRTIAEGHVGWEITPLVAGAPARVVAVVATSPLELIRTFLQSKHVTQSLSDVLYEKLAGQSVMGAVRQLWLGFVPTLWRDVPFSMLYWTLIEHSRYRLKDTGLSTFLVNLSSGAMAGGISAFVTCPFDVMKTRAQMHLDAKSKNGFDNRMVAIAKDLYKEGGIRAFFKGAVPRSVRVAPAAAIMISSYEQSKVWILEYKKSKLKDD